MFTPPKHVMCHVSRVMCHMSHVTSQVSHVNFFFFFLTKWWSLWVEGLLSMGPTPSSFSHGHHTYIDLDSSWLHWPWIPMLCMWFLNVTLLKHLWWHLEHKISLIETPFLTRSEFSGDLSTLGFTWHELSSLFFLLDSFRGVRIRSGFSETEVLCFFLGDINVFMILETMFTSVALQILFPNCMRRKQRCRCWVSWCLSLISPSLAGLVRISTAVRQEVHTPEVQELKVQVLEVEDMDVQKFFPVSRMPCWHLGSLDLGKP